MMPRFNTNTDLFKDLAARELGSEDEWAKLKLPRTFLGFRAQVI